MLDFVVTENTTEQTLISFLKKKFKSTPLSLIYKLFRSKKIQVNNKNIRYYHHRLKKGEKVTIYDNFLKVHQAKISLPAKTKINLLIIYEDENILIVLKEHNIEIHSSKSNNCLNNAVKYYLYQQNPTQYQEQIKSLFIINSVHRIDKLTQGLVIYPKNPVAKRILHNSINDKEKITKKYLAICEYSPKIKVPNYVSGYLWKNEPAEKMEFSLHYERESAKYCALEIKKVRQENKQIVLEITLHTGRKHQIRTILSYFGLPIVGDKKYGSKIEIKNKIYLFAYKILFINLPLPLSYLNGKIFQIKKGEKGLSKFLSL